MRALHPRPRLFKYSRRDKEKKNRHLTARSAMVATCCIVGCSNRHSTGCGKKFFRFPADLKRRSRWVSAVKRVRSDGVWQPSRNDRICSDHFVGGQPSPDPSHPSYIPSVKMGWTGQNALKSSESFPSLDRVRRRESFNQSRAEAFAKDKERLERRDALLQSMRRALELDHGLYCRKDLAGLVEEADEGVERMGTSASSSESVRLHIATTPSKKNQLYLQY